MPLPVTLKEHHFHNAQGYVSGGHSYGRGFSISWQNGPLGRGAERVEPNGAFLEDVLAACAGRLAAFEKTPAACPENAGALQDIKNAIAKLEARTARREQQMTEGTCKGS